MYGQILLTGSVNLYVCIYPTHLTRLRCDTKPIYKRSNASLVLVSFFDVTDCLLLESKWQQVFPSLQDFSQDSDRSKKKGCSQESFGFSSDFQLFRHPLIKPLGAVRKRTNHNWYHPHLHFQQLFFFFFFFFFSFLARFKFLSFFSFSLIFTLYLPGQ